MEVSPTSAVTYDACPACHSDDIHPHLSAKDHTVSHKEFDIWQCRTCSLHFTQHVPSEAEIGAYYQSEEYISHSNTQKGLINRLYQAVRKITLRQKLRIVREKSGSETGRILDLGCGTGEFLDTMQQAGWSVQGIEPDEGAREFARSEYQLSVEPNEALYEQPEAAYDVVSLWHVLEHIHRLHPALDAIHRTLKPGGTLIIAVPNHRSPDAEVYAEHWAAWDVPRHLYHFNPTAMQRLLAEHGFGLREMRPMPFDAFYVSMLSEKYQKGSPGLVSAFFTGLKTYFAARRSPERGSSIIYICSKD